MMTMVVIRVEYISTIGSPPSIMMIPIMEMIMLYDVFVEYQYVTMMTIMIMLMTLTIMLMTMMIN